jgi:DNA-binding response OmpR family regulator
VARILVVDDEPLLCDLFRVWLHDDLGADVECSLTGTIAAQMMIGKHFDLALIDALLPDSSGIALAELAANQNTPALLTSGHPDVIDRLDRFGFPNLKKPFIINSLIAEATSILSNAAQNILRVKASAVLMHSRTQALKAAIEESRRLVEAIAIRQDA